jgi:hypothetical protein
MRVGTFQLESFMGVVFGRGAPRGVPLVPGAWMLYNNREPAEVSRLVEYLLEPR